MIADLPFFTLRTQTQTQTPAYLRVLLLTVASLLLSVACTTLQPTTNISAPEYIDEGELWNITWEIQPAPDSIVIGSVVRTEPTGVHQMRVYADTSVFVRIFVDDLVVIDTLSVSVIPKPNESKFKVYDVEESDSANKYMVGQTSVDRVEKENRKFRMDVFGFSRLHYPDSIVMYVHAIDENGNFVAGMAPPYGDSSTAEKYFRGLVEVIEGEEYPVSDFVVREVHEDITPPNSFGLALDYSGSMNLEGRIDFLRSAVRNFVNSKRAEDEVSGLAFNHDLAFGIEATQSGAEFMNGFASQDRFPDGGTSILWSGGWMVDYLESRDIRNRALVLLTDGEDNSSFMQYLLTNISLWKASDLVYSARERNVNIITVGLGQNVNQRLLQKLAYLTDGQYYHIDAPNELVDLYRALPRMFNNYYTITYKPHLGTGNRAVKLAYFNNVQVDSVTGEVSVGDSVDFAGVQDYPSTSVAYFSLASADLDEQAKQNLQILGHELAAYTNLNLHIVGHTDSEGSDAANKRLSKRRAERVANFLIKVVGIEANRVTTEGAGFERPIYNPEANEFQKSENRRVELIIQ